MQEISSSSPDTSFPSTVQVHQGQLQDYELLLSILRAEVGSLSDFSQMLIRPRAFSPLDQENENGQEALQQLLEDLDYQALCKGKKVSPHYLTVTLKEGAFIYETSNREGGDRTELTLTGSDKWQALQTRIEKSVALLGGQIRYDRLVSAPRMARFYGMAPWNPEKTTEHRRAIKTLEEKLASYQLGLEEDFNLLDLKKSTNDAQFFSLRGLPNDAREELSRQFMTGEIRSAIGKFLPEGVASPLTHLAKDVLEAATTKQVRARPTVYLQKILQGAEAGKLGNLLLSTMGWYGAEPGEETSPYICIKVVASALQIWFAAQLIEYPGRIAGYDFHATVNWGKSYKRIWRDFEKHLLKSRRASSRKEAIVLARLFLCRFPAEFRITDIPAELPYRGSVAWVNFVNGVNLINSTNPQALSRQTFQSLVDLPLKLGINSTKDDLNELYLARLRPATDWAITQGFISQKKYDEYSVSEIEQAVSELDKYTKDLTGVFTALNEDPPDRLSIAKGIVEKHCHVIEFDNPLSKTYWSDHQLAIVPLGARLNPQQYVIQKYSLIDVIAEDKFGQIWSIFRNDGALTEHAISLDEQRLIKTEGSLFIVDQGPVPSTKETFEKKFKLYLSSLTTAYQTLIKSLLVSLPFNDRQALELGELSVYTLRNETYKVEAKYETQKIILPYRTRNGLLLLATYKGVTRTFELLPRAGIIRRIKNLDVKLFGGILRYEDWPVGTKSNSVEVWRNQTLPFDWEAHSTGSTPRKGASCKAIIEQLGQTFMAPTTSPENSENITLNINSNRCIEISDFIATQLLFVDPATLRTSAYGKTKFDSNKATQEKIENVLKFFVPFWKSIEDIASDDMERNVNGAFGLSMELVAFGLPVGKLLSGSAKLVRNAGRLTIRTNLSAFTVLTKDVTFLVLDALNPLALPGLLLNKLWKLGGLGISRIKTMAGRAGQYTFVQSLPKTHNAGHWRPLATGDDLATIKGIDDIPVRNLSPAGNPEYRLIDPYSGKPYGPQLTEDTGAVSIGRSEFSSTSEVGNRIVFDIPENAKVVQVPELNGRTTLIIDGVHYRLDRGSLRRVDLIDASESLHIRPCRIRRAGDQVCLKSYVYGISHPTPAQKSNDPIEDYCLWFGDRIYTPAPPTSTRKESILALDGQLYTGTGDTLSRSLRKRTEFNLPKKRAPKARIDGTIEFKKGMYGRITVKGADEGVDDIRQVGTLIIESKIDKTKEYLFTQLNLNEYYFSEIAKGKSLESSHRLQLVTASLKDTNPILFEELTTVFEGSLQANNMAALYGTENIKDAVKAMDEIAVSIGGSSKPADSMKTIKVATTPGEAVMFDHKTRMIVCKYPETTKTWTRINEAPPQLRQRTAEIFNQLFNKPPPNPNTNNIVHISENMAELQKIVRKHKTMNQPRNIAYAEVKHPDGRIEIFVSVSGGGGDTRFLPIFNKNSYSVKEVTIQKTTYINIDHNTNFERASLSLANGQFQAIPRSTSEIADYTKQIPPRPTSLDSESKLIRVIRQKYPDDATRSPVTIATTMAPCDSCSVVMQQFAHTGGPDALKVVFD